MANCDEIITGGSGSITLATSAVTIYDGGSLGCVTVPVEPSLNDVLEALATTICAIANPNPFSSEVTIDFDFNLCGITIPIGSDLNFAIGKLLDGICANQTAIADINCTTIVAEGCYCTDFSNAYWSSVTPAVVDPPTTLEEVLCNMTSGIEYNYGLISGGITTSARWRDNALENFLYWDTATYGNLSLNPGALTCDVKESVYGIDGTETTIPAQTISLLIANKDNYIDWDVGTASYSIIDVNVGDPEPAKANKENIRLGFVTTNATQVISVTQLKEIQSVGTANIKRNAVTTDTIEDLNVTTPKLSLTGVVAGAYDQANVTVGVDGRITAISTDFNITAPSNNQLLRYDNASSKWVNDNLQSLLPAGASTGDVLKWDGAGSWLSSSNNLGGLQNVDDTGITDTQVLAWNSATSEYLPADNAEPVVIYAINKDELVAAFNTFNAAPARAGIVKLGANIELDGDLTLDFGDGIEIHGGFNNILFNDNSGSYVLRCQGTKVVFKQCKFNGKVDFNYASPYQDMASQIILEMFDPSLSTLVLLDCEFIDVIGGWNGDYIDDNATAVTINPAPNTFIKQGAPIQATRLATWCRFILSNIWISTPETGTGSNKQYGPLGIYYSPTAQPTTAGLQIICNNWALTGLVTSAILPLPGKWRDYKSAMQINVAGGGAPTGGVGAIAYDQSVQIASTTATGDGGGDWIPYPTMRGPVTTEQAVDPTTIVGGIFGNPGDILINVADIYMKHTSAGIDNNWSQIN